ncbi:MAG: polysaccharide biosynthesis protein [Janthinobacterium lividum]
MSGNDSVSRNALVRHGDELDRIVTRRDTSLFAEDAIEHQATLDAMIRGKRILVVGGGGSIGGVTTRLISDFEPAALHVVDQSENYLAELVRDLRGRPSGLSAAIDFRAIPIDYGSTIMQRMLAEARPYDAVLNFAALKHVRSEKDVYSVLQMLDTNVVKHLRFKRWLAEGGHDACYFAVSTDKAANPTSLMGASKRLMEDLVFEVAADRSRSVTSARFANVAFSNGSLLQGFQRRLERLQPLAAPRDTRRYFISHQEAGELCMLATFVAPTGHVVFPKMDPRTELQPLDDIAARFLAAQGYAPEVFDDESEARAAMAHAVARARWPLLLTPLDTSGEKPYEEFVGEGEALTDVGLATLMAVPHRPTRAMAEGLFDVITRLVDDPGAEIEKAGIVAAIQSALSNFNHRESGKNLDQRL